MGNFRRGPRPASFRPRTCLDDEARLRLATAAEVLAVIVELADDGFCKRSALTPRFPKLGERDLRRSIRRAVGLGLLLERRGPDGGIYLALSGEGWELLRSELRANEGATG